MNTYYKLLQKIILKGKIQIAKKNNSIALLNEKLSFNEKQLIKLFNEHKVAKSKLLDELELYMSGITTIKNYNEKGIN